MSSPPTPNPLRPLVFGPFAFDEASGELRKHGVRCGFRVNRYKSWWG